MQKNPGTNRTWGPAVNSETITATKVLVGSSPKFQRLNASTADRDVTLPGVALSYNLWFVIANTGVLYNLIVKNAGGTVIATVRPGGSVLVASDNALWTTSVSGNNGVAAPVDRVIIKAAIAAASVDENVFVADRAYKIKSIKEIHSVAGSDGGTVTLDVRKILAVNVSAPGVAVGTGITECLSAALNLKSTANTSVTGTLVATAADLLLAAGDKIAFNFIGTLTALAGGVVVIELEPQ